MNKIVKTFCLLMAVAAIAGCRSGRDKKAEAPHQEGSVPVERFSTPHGSIDLYCICHGTVAIKFTADVASDSRTILVDPISELYGRRIDYGTVPKADIVLVTHEHPDHMSAGAISARMAKGGRVLASKAVVDSLGFGELITEGQTLSLSSAMTVTAVAAYNTTPKHKQYHPKGTGNGYLLKIDGFSIYIAGDTEPIREMKHLGKVDLALLPVNQPYTMTPAQCAKAAKSIKPGLLIPYHTGETDLDELSKALEAAKVDFVIHEELR